MNFFFHHLETKRAITFTLHSSPSEVCQEQVWVIGGKIVGLRDFQQLQDHLQHLELKVWEHPNLKVSTLILKDQFFKKLVLLSLLRSKMPRTQDWSKSKVLNGHFCYHEKYFSEPNGYLTVLKIPHWFKVMQEEIKILTQNYTYDLVPRPSNANIMGSKWLFKMKLKENGKINRYKTRLVAQGFSKMPSLDFRETFNLVIKHTTRRLIFLLAILLGWTMQ